MHTATAIRSEDAVARAEFRFDLIRIALLAVLVALTWCAFYDRWTVASWETPVTYHSDPEKGDVFARFAEIKAASEGQITPFTFSNLPELGAPYVANWDDYPLTEKPLMMMMGLLARFMGIFAAGNFALMLEFVLAAGAFYVAARLLGAAWVWAFAGGIIFAFARYVFAQGLHHLTITYCWHVPLCVVVGIWMLRGSGIEIGTARFRFALVVALIAGVQSVYYTNIFAQLVLFGGLLQGWRRGWAAVLPAVWITLTAAAAFLLMNANTFAYSLVNGGNDGAVVRSYHWLEIYGLKLVDLVMPPPDHPFPPFADWGAAHLKEIILSPGEMPPSAYLGLVGLAALAWLVIDSLRRVVDGGRPPLEAWLILWIVLYAEVGGLNGIAGVLGAQLFRATTRYSIFILAIVLLDGARRLSATSWGKTSWAYGAAALLALFALWEQTPPWTTSSELAATAQEVASDRDFTEKMEAQLPAQAMVFQVPIMDFPESPAQGVGSYEHFRPYLYAHQLRFSFGSDKGRANGDWQHALAQLPVASVVPMIEGFGFAALYVNLDGFRDKGAELIQELKRMGRTEMFTSENGDLLGVLLKPAPQPVKPDGT